MPNGGDFQGKPFEELFEVEIVKAYTKPMTRQTEEGIFMINVKGELLNSKTEWHQPKLIRTTVHTGGAELAGGRIVSFPVAGAPGGGAEMAGGRITSFPVAGYSSGGGTRASGPPLPYYLSKDPPTRPISNDDIYSWSLHTGVAVPLGFTASLTGLAEPSNTNGNLLVGKK